MILKRRVNKLRITLVLMAVLPVVLLGVFFVLFGIKTIRVCTEKEVMSSLEGVCLRLRDEFSEKYPGDYTIKGDRYYSGRLDVSASTMMLEKYKMQFGTEVTIFFDDVRAMTTIIDSKNKRITGTKMEDPRVLETVKSGGIFTASDVYINGKQYYVCYIPLLEKTETVGMVFAGISNENVEKTIRDFYKQFVTITIVMVLLLAIIVFVYSSQLASNLTSIKEYLGSLVEEGNVETKMGDNLLGRRDEIGGLARYAEKVGGQLTEIIGKDPLTGLYNRRAGRHMLDRLHDEHVMQGTDYTLAMCDVDFFKSVNDTYGHDVGDIVLKEISRIILETCDAYPGSFAIRWGGEEILIGFRLSKIYAVEAIEIMRDRIRAKVFDGGDVKFGVTATFGVASNNTDLDLHSVIVEADEKLYLGKESGRDRIEV